MPGVTKVLIFGEGGEGKPKRSLRAAVAAVAAAMVLIVAAGAYNAIQAPPGAHSYEAQISTLGGSSPHVRQAQLSGPAVAVGTHHIFDAAAGRFLPLDGTADFSASTEGAVDAVAHGDAYAWFDGRGHLRIRDMFMATDVDVDFAQVYSPIRGTLALSTRWAAWNFVEPGGSIGIVGFDRISESIRPVPTPLAGNDSLHAISGDEFYMSGNEVEAVEFVFNASTLGLFPVGRASNLTRPQSGAFFAAWVNVSVPQVEYFDSPTRTVRVLTAPAGVQPSWVRVDNYRVLFGGLKQGFLFASNQVELYDFSTGNAQRFDNVGVDLENHSRLSLGGEYLIAVNEVVAPRPPAPLTPVFLAAAVAALAGAAFLAARASFREEE